jgi:hypothetical protein
MIIRIFSTGIQEELFPSIRKKPEVSGARDDRMTD